MGKALLFTTAILAVLMCAQCQTEIPYPRFEFMGEPLPNNSYIYRGGIHEGSDALMCVSDYAACCSDPPIGEWYDYAGTQVHQGLDGATTLYVTRGVGVVRLHRITGGVSGLWRCDIPNSDGDLQSLYIFTGIDRTGYIQQVELQFSQLHTPPYVTTPEFTLNCTNQGPATIVTWTRNGEIIEEDANHKMTKIILDIHNPSVYENTLTVRGRESGQYQCTVRNSQRHENRNHGSSSLTVEENISPIPVSIVPDTTTSIKVLWQYISSPQNSSKTWTNLGYKVFYKKASEKEWSVIDVGSTEKPVTIEGLSDDDESYNVSVVALSRHLASDINQGVMSYGRIYFELYFHRGTVILSINWSQDEAEKMKYHLADWLASNIARKCDCSFPPDNIKAGVFFGEGISYRGFIGGEDGFMYEIKQHIRDIVQQNRFIPVGNLYLRLSTFTCRVLLTSFDERQCPYQSGTH